MEEKLVIIGASGLLGSMLRTYAKEQSRYDIHSLSLRGISRNLSAVSNALGDWPSGTVVVNTAALKYRSSESVDLTELEFVNSTLPHMLATICKDNCWWLIQISTDGVFSGSQGGYSENDIPDARDPYGLSKIKGEPVESALVLRQSIIGPELSRHQSLMGWLARNKGGTISGYRNCIWQGMTSLSLSKTLLMLIDQFHGMTGLLHLSSPHALSKGELLIEIATHFSWNIDVELVDALEGVDRSMKSESGLVAALKILPIEDQLVELHQFVNEHASCYSKYLNSRIR